MQMAYTCGALMVVLISTLASCTRSPTRHEPIDALQHLLAVGATVPDLTGVDQHGYVQRLRQNVGHPTLVYFYPKDGTPGCTKEACAFRDVWRRFEQSDVRLLGVSRDDQASHEKFAREHTIPFPLIADSDANWAAGFGVHEHNGRDARVSFLFDITGHLSKVYPNVDPGVHANQVLSDITAIH